MSVEINDSGRSEEHTSELQSQSNLVCRLLLEQKKEARRLGFDLAGACPAVTPTGLSRFHEWLSAVFFFNDPSPTEIYTLSLHDALPIFRRALRHFHGCAGPLGIEAQVPHRRRAGRSEEHTSELQSQSKLVCRLLLEKKKKLSSIYLFYNVEKNSKSKRM